MVVPTLLYGSETWTPQKRHRSKTKAMEVRYLRKVEGVTRLDRVSNEDIRRRLGVEPRGRPRKKWIDDME